MSKDKPTNSKPPLLHPLVLLPGAAVASAVAWVASPQGDMTLPIKPLSIIGTAFLALLVAWASWTYLLYKRDSKRERIADALKKGRLICHCSEDGEIMTQHHHTGGTTIDAYACAVCGHVEVVSPVGEVLIAENTEFKPKLPATARMMWLQDSEQQR